MGGWGGGGRVGVVFEQLLNISGFWCKVILFVCSF